MGGRSRKKSGGTVQDQSAAQMRANEKHKVSNYTMLDILEQLQGNQLEGILPLFGGMVGGGLQLFNQNPNMPRQMDLSGFQIPQAPPPPPPQEAPPQQGMYNYGVPNAIGIPVPRGKHTFGGIK